jgi:16S rRNA (cytosine1402-N4)-methyltransferase
VVVLWLVWVVVRLVKHFLQAHSRPNVPERLPLRASEMPEAALRIVGRAVRASAAETTRNPRARSAILRVAARTAGTFQPASQPNVRIDPGARWRN